MVSHCLQLPNGINTHMPALHLNHRSLWRASRVIYELNDAVNSFISTFPLFSQRSGLNQTKRPLLELVAVLPCQSLGGSQIYRLANNLELNAGKAILQAVAHEGNS